MFTTRRMNNFSFGQLTQTQTCDIIHPVYHLRHQGEKQCRKKKDVRQKKRLNSSPLPVPCSAPHPLIFSRATPAIRLNAFHTRPESLFPPPHLTVTAEVSELSIPAAPPCTVAFSDSRRNIRRLLAVLRRTADKNSRLRRMPGT